jgi:hypothetical protein
VGTLGKTGHTALENRGRVPGFPQWRNGDGDHVSQFSTRFAHARERSLGCPVSIGKKKRRAVIGAAGTDLILTKDRKRGYRTA